MIYSSIEFGGDSFGVVLADPIGQVMIACFDGCFSTIRSNEGAGSRTDGKSQLVATRLQNLLVPFAPRQARYCGQAALQQTTPRERCSRRLYAAQKKTGVGSWWANEHSAVLAMLLPEHGRYRFCCRLLRPRADEHREAGAHGNARGAPPMDKRVVRVARRGG